MNYVIYLTDTCNLNCKYCYENKYKREISFESIKQIVDREINNKTKNCELNFFGGEPLLKKDLIFDIIDYINSKNSNTKFTYAMTTNGTLIDDKVLEYIKENDFRNLGFSIDGIKEMQDLNRRTVNDKGTFDIASKNAKKLLEINGDLAAMMVVTKNNINKLKENVEYLFNLGFKLINPQFNYLDDWQDEDLEIIRSNYTKLSELYYDKIFLEQDVSILMFDEKIYTHVKKDYNCNDSCKLCNKTTINVGTDGNMYPCMQFVYKEKYIVGNVKEGLDKEKLDKIALEIAKENETCKNCKLKVRCKHMCPCKNILTTNSPVELSPLVCELERITIDVADKMAEKLYKNNSKMFIQKYYNKNYNLFNKIINKKK